MMAKMIAEELDIKLKMERVKVCLNCENVGMFEECADYSEVDRKMMVVIIGLSEYVRLTEV